ncbi:hypothetical protein LMG31886_21930 [Xanthomonas hydrangeae]|uniref:efflux RND transporter periplasmic adaptor subunit n=1 Tax=Xanthomonas hydrangeae TaxID=2775159 RepID=UPI001965B70A|nr:hypothetical protein LMG31884_22470 [Xanthomonas hydrangeae]CAD7716605.1 hypothetical protein LMG31884_22470 [Xanthomonas hydrangeae]CAD7732154.1 hypothetical protein LMG31887_22460 [Xanthomonas hydrangeae]CAD7732157.1 hypothetical protein LMG31887_22460 [Xanthomonas hydrangeae]CAD7735088.1 hypothetical protein LMG31886_21930 [Xanthomonas hydrangeae]
MKHSALVLTMTLACVSAACSRQAGEHAAPAPSALVQVQRVRQGAVPEVVVGYGQAQGQASGSLAMNVMSDGRVVDYNVAQGDHVHAGQRLAQFSLSPLAMASYQQALDALRAAEAQRAQTERLFDDALATQDQREQSRRAVGDARSALKALRQQQAGQGTIALTAPFTGTVSSLSATVGDALTAGTTVLTLVSDRSVVARVGVEPGRLPRQGAPAVLHPLNEGNRVSGRVVRIGTALNAASRLIDVDVQPETPLRLGTSYKAELSVGKLIGWIVPPAAVLTDVEGAWVFQVADGKARKVRVDVLGQVGNATVVQGKLADGSTVAVVGASQLEDGMAVHFADRAMFR